MRLLKSYFLIIIPFIGILLLFGNSRTVEAKKYYSLQNIGLSRCTTDDIDYVIISIRGNTIKYVKYQLSEKTCEWEQTGGVRKATLTSKTKYYMGNPQKVSDSLKKKAEDGNNKNKNIGNDIKNWNKADTRKNLAKKVKNIDTEKWICRVRKGTIKKKIYERNNEIRIKNGNVTKLAVELSY